MARIISTNLNSAPEIRLGDTTLTPAPSLNQVQGKDWTELKSPPRFDSFRLVTQVRNHYDALLSGLKYLKNIFNAMKFYLVYSFLKKKNKPDYCDRGGLVFFF